MRSQPVTGFQVVWVHSMRLVVLMRSALLGRSPDQGRGRGRETRSDPADPGGTTAAGLVGEDAGAGERRAVGDVAAIWALAEQTHPIPPDGERWASGRVRAGALRASERSRPQQPAQHGPTSATSRTSSPG